MRNISRETFLSFHVKLIYNAISKKQKLIKTDILKVSRTKKKLKSQRYLLAFFFLA